jgi:hypothetical protein
MTLSHRGIPAPHPKAIMVWGRHANKGTVWEWLCVIEAYPTPIQRPLRSDEIMGAVWEWLCHRGILDPYPRAITACGDYATKGNVWEVTYRHGGAAHPNAIYGWSTVWEWLHIIEAYSIPVQRPLCPKDQWHRLRMILYHRGMPPPKGRMALRFVSKSHFTSMTPLKAGYANATDTPAPPHPGNEFY